MKIAFVTVAVVLALAGGGCARSSPPVPSSPDLPSVQMLAPSQSVPADAGAETLTGKVTAGVEAGCLLLDGHLLVFDDPALKAEAAVGAEITVVGRAVPEQMSTCQQGKPFLVTAVR